MAAEVDKVIIKTLDLLFINLFLLDAVSFHFKLYAILLYMYIKIHCLLWLSNSIDFYRSLKYISTIFIINSFVSKHFSFPSFSFKLIKKNLMIFHVMFKSRAIFYEITFTKQFARFTNYTIIIYFSLVQFITSSSEVMILEAVYLYICFEIEIKFSFNVKLYLHCNFKNYIYF